MAHSIATTIRVALLSLSLGYGGCTGAAPPPAETTNEAPLAIESIPECQRWLADGEAKASAAPSAELREKLQSEARGRRQALTRLAENPATRPTLGEHCRKLSARKH